MKRRPCGVSSTTKARLESSSELKPVRYERAQEIGRVCEGCVFFYSGQSCSTTCTSNIRRGDSPPLPGLALSPQAVTRGWMATRDILLTSLANLGTGGVLSVDNFVSRAITEAG